MNINPLDLIPSLLILLIFVLSVNIFKVYEPFDSYKDSSSYGPSTSRSLYTYDIIDPITLTHSKGVVDTDPTLFATGDEEEVSFESGESCNHNDVCASKYCRRTTVKQTGVCQPNYILEATTSKFSKIAPMPYIS